MFEDGVKLDDILNVLKPPTLDEDEKKNQQVPDSAIRYQSRQTPADVTMKFDFAGRNEVLK